MERLKKALSQNPPPPPPSPPIPPESSMQPGSDPPKRYGWTIVLFLLLVGVLIALFSVPGMPSDFYHWLIAVFSHWQNWLSGGGAGGALLLIVLLYERLWNKQMPKRWYIPIFIFGFVILASFMAWRDQVHIANNAQAQLDSLTKPKLSGLFKRIGAAPTGDHKQDCLATITVYIENLGAPTAIKDVTFTASREGKSYQGQFLPIAAARLADEKMRRIVYPESHHLFNKAQDAAIQTNVPMEAYFQVLLRGITRDEFMDNKTKLVLHYKDVATGTPHDVDRCDCANPQPEELLDVPTLLRQSR